ncbi:MAG TPA: hypothetical protein VD927_17880, partial [Chryseosolibacter sp.]|nr:hypothetical protein [Chryseosolibacter sp.]
MKKCFLLAMISVFAWQYSSAQSADKEAVAAAIDKLFKAMELGDSAMARQVLDDQMTGATIFKDKSGAVNIRREKSSKEFLDAIGSPHDVVWHEEIWNLKIQVDGDFAQAWCDYAFYAGKTFSHCGVDAMQFYRKDGVWKMFHIADTRRKTGCEIP